MISFKNIHSFLPFIILLFTPFFAAAQCGSPISSFPYQEDFETSDGGWTSGGTGDDWAWGAPSKPVISGAGNGAKCWISGGLTISHYTNGERSYVQSPCFDFTNIPNPFIRFKICWETENQYDGANLQYSINNGTSWSNVGAYGDAANCQNENWYNNSSITNLNTLSSVKAGWSGTIQPTSGSCLGGQGSNGWLYAKHTMSYLGGEPQVIFRFTFGAGTQCNDYDGFAFDMVTISDAPAQPSLSYLSTPAGCDTADGSTSISVTGGTGPFVYAWSPNVSSGLQANGLAAGTYTVSVTDSFGCSASIETHVPSSPAVTLSSSALPDTCNQGKGLATAIASSGTPPYQYVWSNGVTSGTIDFLVSSSYVVTVTDSKGCESTGEVFVDNTGNIEVSLGSDRTICGNSGTLLHAGTFDQYLWQDGSTGEEYQVTEPGVYYVSVENNNGCSASDTIEVTENCLDDVLLPNAFTPNDDGRNDLFKGTGTGITSWLMEVRGRWGNLVFQSKDVNDGWDGKQNGIASQAGIYVWKVYFSIEGSNSREKTGSVMLIR